MGYKGVAIVEARGKGGTRKLQTEGYRKGTRSGGWREGEVQQVWGGFYSGKGKGHLMEGKAWGNGPLSSENHLSPPRVTPSSRPPSDGELSPCAQASSFQPLFEPTGPP